MFMNIPNFVTIRSAVESCAFFVHWTQNVFTQRTILSLVSVHKRLVNAHKRLVNIYECSLFVRELFYQTLRAHYRANKGNTSNIRNDLKRSCSPLFESVLFIYFSATVISLQAHKRVSFSQKRYLQPTQVH
jgi:hypothetical protein